eukprot:COSAG06_NODE_562_length_14275_cov_28.599041_13_plen_84_part_00
MIHIALHCTAGPWDYNHDMMLSYDYDYDMIRTGRRLSGAAGVVLEGLDVLRHRAVVAAVVDRTKQNNKTHNTQHTTQNTQHSK